MPYEFTGDSCIVFCRLKLRVMILRFTVGRSSPSWLGESVAKPDTKHFDLKVIVVTSVMTENHKESDAMQPCKKGTCRTRGRGKCNYLKVNIVKSILDVLW